MNNIINKKNYYKNILYTISLSILLSLLPKEVFAQTIHKNIIELNTFNESLNKYNQTYIKFEYMSPKFDKIKFNVILKVHINNLKNLNKKINLQISDIKNKLSNNNYDKNELFSDINILNENIKIFEKKFNTTIAIYDKFQNTKLIFGKFIKIFLISISIGIAAFIIIVFIITFIVVKRQRKYYILKEEVSIEQEKNTRNVNVNNLNKKDNNTITSHRSFIRNEFKKISLTKFFFKKK